MAETQRTLVNPATVPPPIGLYSHVARVRGGEILFIAGQVSIGDDGSVVGEGDVAAQTGQVFRNIGRILDGVGASFGNVVELTTYVVGRESVPAVPGRPGRAVRRGISRRRLPAQYPAGGRRTGAGGVSAGGQHRRRAALAAAAGGPSSGAAHRRAPGRPGCTASRAARPGWTALLIAGRPPTVS